MAPGSVLPQYHRITAAVLHTAVLLYTTSRAAGFPTSGRLSLRKSRHRDQHTCIHNMARACYSSKHNLTARPRHSLQPARHQSQTISTPFPHHPHTIPHRSVRPLFEPACPPPPPPCSVLALPHPPSACVGVTYARGTCVCRYYISQALAFAALQHRAAATRPTCPYAPAPLQEYTAPHPTT